MHYKMISVFLTSLPSDSSDVTCTWLERWLNDSTLYETTGDAP